MASEGMETGRQDVVIDAWNRLSEILSRPQLPPARLVADMAETSDGTAYILEIPVPGLTADEISITASSDMLTVEVVPKSSAAGQGRRYLVQEVPREPGSRVFTFPTLIDVDNVTARIQGGILTIHVLKAEGSPGRTIPVEH